jgi:hypothetical protein
MLNGALLLLPASALARLLGTTMETPFTETGSSAAQHKRAQQRHFRRALPFLMEPAMPVIKDINVIRFRTGRKLVVIISEFLRSVWP